MQAADAQFTGGELTGAGFPHRTRTPEVECPHQGAGRSHSFCFVICRRWTWTFVWNAKHFIHLHGQGTKKGGRGGASRVLPLYRQKPPRSPCCELARTGHTTTHPRKVLREQGTRGLWSALTMVAMQISVIAAAWIRVSRDEVTSSFPGQPGGPRTHGGSPHKCQCLLQVGNFYSVFKASQAL